MTGRTILLVEDNPDDVFAFNWALRKTKLGWPVQVATDGRQAVAYLGGDGEFADRARYPVPCVVMLDLKLPYMGGHEVLEWIRLQPSYATLPVIILSGSDEERDHKRARENGANGYFVKPIEPDDLAAILKSSCP